MAESNEQDTIQESMNTEEQDAITESGNNESVNTEEQDAIGESPNSEEETEETFPRAYVEELRQENGKYRQRAQRADDLAARLHVELVRATGRLADPEDLDFNEEHLEDPEALMTALEDLLARKPHLADRRPRGDVGQGHTSSGTGVDLAGILRAAAS